VQRVHTIANTVDFIYLLACSGFAFTFRLATKFYMKAEHSKYIINSTQLRDAKSTQSSLNHLFNLVCHPAIAISLAWTESNTLDCVCLHNQITKHFFLMLTIYAKQNHIT